eukprot:12627024-Heterocapsa_arctica.AAC.1
MVNVKLILLLAPHVDLLQHIHHLVLDLVLLALIAALFFCRYSFLLSASTSSRSRSGYLHQTWLERVVPLLSSYLLKSVSQFMPIRLYWRPPLLLLVEAIRYEAMAGAHAARCAMTVVAPRSNVPH